MPLIAGATALALAYAGNRLIWRLCPRYGTAWLVPAWEEAAKTLLGLLAGRIAVVHGLFGLGEAVLEMNRGLAAPLALFSHVLFGLLTEAARRRAGLIPAWLMAACVHSAWNLWHLKLKAGRKPFRAD